MYDGLLRISTLEEADNLPLYTEVTNGVAVNSIAGMRDLHFLRCLSVVRGFGFSISRNEDLERLEGLERLQQLVRLSIAENPALETLDGLENLRRVEREINIDKNASLRSIGLPALEEAEKIIIGDLGFGELATEDPFPLYECEPNGNQVLETIGSFESLRHFDLFKIEGNAALTSISALNALAGAGRINETDNLPFPQVVINRNTSLPYSDVAAVSQVLGDTIEFLSCGNQDETEACEFCLGPGSPGGP